MPPKTRKGDVAHKRPESKLNSGSLSKKIHQDAKYEDTTKVEEPEKSKQDLINENLSPLQTSQFDLIIGVIGFMQRNFTSEKFVITLVVGFLMNLIYAKFNESYEEDLYNIGFCWLGALTSYVVSYILQQRAITKTVNEGRLPADSPHAIARAPSFDKFYATTLPVMACFLLNKKMLTMNLAMSYLLLELPSPVKLFISVTVMYNFDKGDNFLDCTFIPTLEFVTETTIDYYTGSSLTETEKYTFAMLFVNLMYSAPNNGDQIMVILKYLVYWFGGMIFINTPIYQLFQSTKSAKLKVWLIIAMYVVFTGGFYFGVCYSLTPILGEHPITWLVSFIKATELRFDIFRIWLAISLFLVPITLEVTEKWELQWKRKIWHFIVFAMLLYPLIVDPELVKLALIGLGGLFMVAEVLRITKLPPCGPQLLYLIQPFQDSRDEQGPMVISYLFLICGVALPIFFNNSVAGLICLGVGDAAASVVGKTIGQVKWFDGKKTVEGTMAFIFLSTLAMYLYKYFGGVDYSWNTIFMSCVFTAILEGLSEVNDNLMAPIFMFTMLEALHSA